MEYPNDPVGRDYRSRFKSYDDGDAASAIVTIFAMILFIGAIVWWGGNHQTNVASNDAPAIGMNGPAPTAPAR
jgi:hypothetical protein